jgi:heme-degrading monooxygenase HmoA
MFARSVTMRIKSNTLAEFNKALEKEILPLLQKQKGFRDELTLVSPDGPEVVAISLWDHKEDAEAYNRTTYSEVKKLLSKVIEGTPQVQNYEVSLSTFHKTTARHGVSA